MYVFLEIFQKLLNYAMPHLNNLEIQALNPISKKNKFGWFAYYCWGAGILTIILSLAF